MDSRVLIEPIDFLVLLTLIWDRKSTGLALDDTFSKIGFFFCFVQFLLRSLELLCGMIIK